MRLREFARSATGDEEDSATGEGLVRWLEDCGRRTVIRRVDEALLSCPKANPLKVTEQVRRLLILGVLALASAQFLYVDTMERILLLRSIIVFV